ncbi:hypothetical protein M5D96_010657 [Drosophila gunungcola]|uniref:Uncharacterized protein n=1 Tax=Drosophila gunungcola TaxID=103775 RepID=A0A9Q0BM49_9MUSC|nr:hypothetical protein M5D96_010657 [Drosophila gunungcola]
MYQIFYFILIYISVLLTDSISALGGQLPAEKSLAHALSCAKKQR